MIITSFRRQTTKKLIKEKRLSKGDVMILIEHLCILNNKKMEKDGKKIWLTNLEKSCLKTLGYIGK